MNEAVYQCTRCFGIHAVDLTHQPCTAEAPKQKLHTDKLASYLQQENEVLIERVRLLEIAIAAEREACAKVADAYGYHMEKEAFDKGSDAEMEAMISAANSIASLIRGRSDGL